MGSLLLFLERSLFSLLRVAFFLSLSLHSEIHSEKTTELFCIVVSGLANQQVGYNLLQTEAAKLRFPNRMSAQKQSSAPNTKDIVLPPFPH